MYYYFQGGTPLPSLKGHLTNLIMEDLHSDSFWESMARLADRYLGDHTVPRVAPNPLPTEVPVMHASGASGFLAIRYGREIPVVGAQYAARIGQPGPEASTISLFSEIDRITSELAKPTVYIETGGCNWVNYARPLVRQKLALLVSRGILEQRETVGRQYKVNWRSNDWIDIQRGHYDDGLLGPAQRWYQLGATFNYGRVNRDGFAAVHQAGLINLETLT